MNDEVTLLRVPRMGSVENATVISWLLPEGAKMAAGQAVCEVETDKTVTTVEAAADGILVRQLAGEGDQLKVGDAIGLVSKYEVSADEIESTLERLLGALQQAPATTVAMPENSAIDGAASAAAAAGAARISPLVRRLAKEHGVDLVNVVGTGPEGRVTGDDILQAASRVGSTAPGVLSPLPVGYDDVPVERVRHSTRRMAIARRLSESVRTTPQLTADMQIDLTRVLAERARINAVRAQAGQSRLSVLTFIAHAAVQLLSRHPDLNATFGDLELLRWKTVNLAIGVDSPDGLMVPVIRSAETLGLEQLGEAIATVADRVRQGNIRSEEMEGGTFTISNPGAMGPVLRAEAILNPPQVALLGLPAILRTPVIVDGPDSTAGVEIRHVIRPSLTFDHRALDGGHVIRFLNELKERLES